MKTRDMDGYNGSDISVFETQPGNYEVYTFLRREAKTPPNKNVVLEDELSETSLCKL